MHLRYKQTKKKIKNKKRFSREINLPCTKKCNRTLIKLKIGKPCLIYSNNFFPVKINLIFVHMGKKYFH